MAIRETPCHKPERPAVKTVGRLGVGDMVLYFGEREAHNRTKQELAELRASLRERDGEQQPAQQQRDREQRTAQQQRDAGQLEFMQQQAEINRIMLDTLQFLVAEVRELRAQRNGSGSADDNPTAATS